jgi:hypothetical protein
MTIDLAKTRTALSNQAQPHAAQSEPGVYKNMPDRTEMTLSRFPAGVVYTIEFEDGTAIDIHEDDLEPFCEDS